MQSKPHSDPLDQIFDAAVFSFKSEIGCSSVGLSFYVVGRIYCILVEFGQQILKALCSKR